MLGGFWEGLGPHLGRVLDGLGHLLGALGRLLDASWALKSQQYHDTSDFFRFLVDLGGILEDLGRSGEEFGRIWEGLVRNLGGFWSLSANSGQILEMLGIIWPCWEVFSIRTPALVREASQCAGVTPPA